MSKLKIGIYGSAIDESPDILSKAIALGEEIGNKKDEIIVVTGACPGMPYSVASTAASRGVSIWGFSPEISFDEHKKAYPSEDSSIYKKIQYVPRSFEFSGISSVRKKYRNVTSTATVDAGIIISGRWGTLNEFTNLVDFGKVIGVFTGTGGVADKLPQLTKNISKKTDAVVIFEQNPKLLLAKILTTLASRSS